MQSLSSSQRTAQNFFRNKRTITAD